MKDFFISYNKADRTWAEWIAWQLEEARYSVVVQAWDFRPGSNFVLEMQRTPESFVSSPLSAGCSLCFAAHRSLIILSE